HRHTVTLHDALPIFMASAGSPRTPAVPLARAAGAVFATSSITPGSSVAYLAKGLSEEARAAGAYLAKGLSAISASPQGCGRPRLDRKSTRLNSSHVK